MGKFKDFLKSDLYKKNNWIVMMKFNGRYCIQGLWPENNRDHWEYEDEELAVAKAKRYCEQHPVNKRSRSDDSLMLKRADRFCRNNENKVLEEILNADDE